jgi:hypothetical protein
VHKAFLIKPRASSSRSEGRRTGEYDNFMCLRPYSQALQAVLHMSILISLALLDRGGKAKTDEGSSFYLWVQIFNHVLAKIGKVRKNACISFRSL